MEEEKKKNVVNMRADVRESSSEGGENRRSNAKIKTGFKISDETRFLRSLVRVTPPLSSTLITGPTTRYPRSFRAPLSVSSEVNVFSHKKTTPQSFYHDPLHYLTKWQYMAITLR
jgi:hypothetical protein